MARTNRKRKTPKTSTEIALSTGGGVGLALAQRGGAGAGKHVEGRARRNDRTGRLGGQGRRQMLDSRNW